MIVNDIQNYSQTQRVRAVDEIAQIIRSSVQACRGKEVDTIVAPSELSRKIRNRHHLDNADADAFQFGQLLGRGTPGAFGWEWADVHFINDLALQLHTGPL